MGSGGSKACGCSDVPSSSENNPLTCNVIRKVRSRGGKILFPSCLRPYPRRLCDNQNLGHRYGENGADALIREQSRVASNQVNAECDVKDNAVKPYGLPRVSSISEHDEWNEATFQNTASGVGSSSARNSSDQPLNHSNSFLSRLSFFPGNISFKLNRASSIGSSRAYPLSSTNLTISGNEEEFHVGRQSTGPLFIADEIRQGSHSGPLSACMNSRSPRQHCEDALGHLGSNIPPYHFSGHFQDGHMILNDNTARSEVNGTTGRVANLHLPRNLSEAESMDSRRADRRTTAREPIENNVHFSRTLSVGRLRDRVIRRSTISDLSAFPLHQDREENNASQNSHGRGWGAERSSLMRANVAVQPALSGNLLLNTSNFGSNNPSYDLEASHPRETRYHDLLEHRSNFLERRRRIRSQVRALQRLGNRFENLSGHERSCILSGQHRSGRCSCRISSRDSNQNDDASARTSISRIVMLAEALFEVLDEIHQQSVVLSSRPSVSAIGSIPAPIEVVDALPVKLHSYLHKQQIEDASQCYICLLEYEEGDNIRVLPCHHEFHKSCVDKWLKEIHRVCPLCRGDVCITDSLPSES